MKTKIMLTMLITGLSLLGCGGQKAADSQDLVDEMKGGLDVAVSYLNELNQRTDFFDTVAQTMKNNFDALVKVGFAVEQVIQIVAGFAAKPDK